MINRQKLQRLAKLRQFKDGDLKEFMVTQFRQNMLAIESAIQALIQDPFYVRTQIDPLTVLNNTTGQITFLKSSLQSDFNGCIIDDSYLVKSSGFYEVWPNFETIFVNGVKDIDFQIWVNGAIRKETTVFFSSSTSQIYVPFSIKIPIELNTNDVLTFFIGNSSGSNSNDCTVAAGTLEIKQLTGVR